MLHQTTPAEAAAKFHSYEINVAKLCDSSSLIMQPNSETGMIEQARRAPQTVTADWAPVTPPSVEGVRIKEIRNVVIRSGVLTECFRPEWFGPSFQAAHIVHMALLPGGLSNWHCHRRQSDVILAVRGQLRIGLYDGRAESTTYRSFSALNVSIARPTAVFVPPLVWHAIKNPSGQESAYIVVNDEVFDYAAPDDWTLPPDRTRFPIVSTDAGPPGQRIYPDGDYAYAGDRPGRRRGRRGPYRNRYRTR